MFLKNIVVSLFTITALGACTSYDSNAVNQEMLQGNWIKVDDYYVKDSILMHQAMRDTTILTFRNDSLFEHFKSTNDSTSLKFIIDNYRMLIFRNDSLVNWLYIDSISNDRMSLSITNMSWKYKKIN